MAGNSLKERKKAGIAWSAQKLLKMVINGWKWQEMTEIAGHGWKLLEMDKYGYKQEK